MSATTSKYSRPGPVLALLLGLHLVLAGTVATVHYWPVDTVGGPGEPCKPDGSCNGPLLTCQRPWTNPTCLCLPEGRR